MILDEALFKARGLTWTQDGDLLHIAIPDHLGVVQVFVINGELDLVPERSHHHRALIEALS
jgi:hypothetical protein